MCGRVFVRSSAEELIASFAWVRSHVANAGEFWPRYNGSPGQDYPLIVREPDEPGGMFVVARWGFIPRWSRNSKIKPINATAEKIAASGMFRSAYRSHRALMPIDGFFEWRATKPPKQPYAIAMKDGKPFCLAAIWEESKQGRTFAVVTCPANELVGQIHHRMPVIIAAADYDRWLSDAEPGPPDLLRPYPAELMTMWPISTRVNRPTSSDPEILDPI
jgi:putative SOS response-associated peptidase YedK